MVQKLNPSLSQKSLTSLEENFPANETFLRNSVKFTHTHTIGFFKQGPTIRYWHTCFLSHKRTSSKKLGVSVGRSDSRVIGGEILCLHPHPTVGLLDDHPCQGTKSMETVGWKRVSFPDLIDLWHLKATGIHILRSSKSDRIFPLFIFSSLVESDWDLREMIVQKLLPLGQQQVLSWQWIFLGALCLFLEEIFNSQNNWILTKVKKPPDSFVKSYEKHVIEFRMNLYGMKWMLKIKLISSTSGSRCFPMKNAFRLFS